LALASAAFAPRSVKGQVARAVALLILDVSPLFGDWRATAGDDY
jgi:hypothetical protein